MLKIWLIEVSPINGIDMAVHRAKKAYKYVLANLRDAHDSGKVPV